MENDPIVGGFFESPYSPEEVSRLARSRDPFERWEAANALQFVDEKLAEELRSVLAEDDDELVRASVITATMQPATSRNRKPKWRSARNLSPFGDELRREGETENGEPLFLDRWGYQHDWLHEDREKELFLCVRIGSSAERQAAIEELVACHYGLVKSIALSLQNLGAELEDLVQEGLSNVISAIDTFDETRGHRFSAYLNRTIRTSAIRAIDETMRTVRIPSHGVEKYYKYIKLFRQNYGEEIPLSAHEELSREVETTAQTMQMIISALAEMPSLNSKQHRKSFEQLEDEQDPYEEIEAAQLTEILDWSLSDLTPREEGVMRMRYGIDDETPRTLDEIGETYGITRERVRQVEAVAMAKLRAVENLEILRPFIFSGEAKPLLAEEPEITNKLTPDSIPPNMASSYSGQNKTVKFRVGSVGYKNGHTYINSHLEDLFYIFVPKSRNSINYEALEVLLVDRIITVSGVLRSRKNGRFSIELRDANQINFVPPANGSLQQLQKILEQKKTTNRSKMDGEPSSIQSSPYKIPDSPKVRKGLGGFFGIGQRMKS